MTNQKTEAGPEAKADSKSVDSIRKTGNQLIGQRSRYLLDHAHNPVYWYPWEEETLKRSRQQKKPIFLSIGYAACHWCHVMEHEVFENDTIATYLNQHFISIKVDREERPDLDDLYMNAVIAMNGNGGWPLSVFLNPNLEPFFGGTYFPPDYFLKLIKALHRIHTTQTGEVYAQAKKITDHIQVSDQILPGSLSDIHLDPVIEMAKQIWDPVDGGFQSNMKFPMPVRWQMLLHGYRLTKDETLADMIKLTLSKMSSGGIHDQLGGGFHRYATDSIWMVPHFEKMLYDNAQLADLYLESAAVFDNRHYAQVAKSTYDFMLDQMWSEESGFYASIDADVDGEEGTTYLWTPEEIIQASDTKYGPALAAFLSVTNTGNFEGRNVLSTRSQPEKIAKDFQIKPVTAAGLFEKYRASMLNMRQQRKQPIIDTKVITSWNGLAISSLARAYRYFGDHRYLKAARQATDYLFRVHYSTGRMKRVSNAGEAANDGILDDYAFMIRGMIELYQATGKVDQLKKAVRLLDETIAGFGHPNGMFYLTHSKSQLTLARRLSLQEGVLPSGNAVMLQNLLRVAALLGRPSYRKLTEKSLQSSAQLMRTHGLEMSSWFEAAMYLFNPIIDVVICGDRNQPDTQALIKRFNYRLPTHAVLSIIPPQGASDADIAWRPAMQGKTAVSGRATAYVCVQNACKRPTHDPDELEKQLYKDWQ